MSNLELINLAKEVKKNAYVPVTNFKVGAAVLCDDNSVYTGTNVEELALPAMSICAERNALQNAFSAGKRNFIKIAVVGGKGDEIDKTLIPCGMCLQYMIDMCEDIKIVCYIDGKIVEKNISEFLHLRVSEALEFFDNIPKVRNIDLNAYFSISFLRLWNTGNSLVVQWSGLWASTLGGMAFVPCQKTKILQAIRCNKRKWYSICLYRQ